VQQTQQNKIRVLVGDTSVRSRLVLSGMIDAVPFLEVVETAQTKEELLFKAVASYPDLIVTQAGLTMSGKLPAFTPLYGEGSSLLLMGSSKITRSIYSHPEGILSFRQKGPGEKEAFQTKETCKTGLLNKLRELASLHTMVRPVEEISSKATASYSWRQPASDLVSGLVPESPLSVIVLGASTGGSTAIEYLIKDLALQQPAVILVAVHMPEKFTKRLAQRLQKLTKWKVEEGVQGKVLASHTIVIAPGGNNMRVTPHPFWPNLLSLEVEKSEALDSPSVNELMISAAKCAREQVLGVIMTGMGQDGTLGAKEIIRQGGIVIAQDEATSSIYGMAKAAVESGAVNGEFALGQINSIINRFVADRHRSHMLQRIAIG
jgi:two-component system, chemotaxis family, protein-glutamate methylesterase/glutaminase